jgi:hypothetical protein
VSFREELACYSLAASIPLKDANNVVVVVMRGARVRLIYLGVVAPSV